MKRVISLLLTVVMLMTVCSVTAFAKGAEPTTGPAKDKASVIGGARINFNDHTIPGGKNVMKYDTVSEQLVIDNEAVPGAAYDLESNTLTLRDFDSPDSLLTLWSVGDDFKLRIEGRCSLASIDIYEFDSHYSSSLSIVGTGKLTINEKKLYEVAIDISASDENNNSKLSIADSVTVDAYACSFENEQPVVFGLYRSGVDSADKAVTVGSKPLEGIKSEQEKISYADSEYVAVPHDFEKKMISGHKAISKTDPDGVYAAVESYDKNKKLIGYTVKRFILVPEYGKYASDDSFGVKGKRVYPVDEFENEFTLVIDDQPKELYVTSEWREKNLKGELGVKMKKSDDPDSLYIGVPLHGSQSDPFEDPEYYYISKLKWDESESMYVEDTSFWSDYCYPDDLAANGFEILYEEADVRVTLNCWRRPAPYTEENHNYTKDFDRLTGASDPDGIYVATGTFVDRRSGTKGIVVRKVFYDSENEVYYCGSEDDDPDNEIDIPYEQLKNGSSEFTYMTEKQQVQAKLRYFPLDYRFEHYALKVEMLKKGDETGYCCDTVIYDDEPNTTYHNIYKMTYNEADGHYYIDSDEDGEIRKLEDLTDQEVLDAGYSYVTEKKPVDLLFDGAVSCSESRVFLDDSGKKYVIKNDIKKNTETVYEIDKSKTFKNGDTTYFLVKERPDLKISDLKSTEWEELINAWNYTLEAAEYHHKGTGKEFLLGDANGDGEVTVIDATCIQRKLVNLSVVVYIEKAADVDGDGEVTILDAAWIQRYLAGLSSPLKKPDNDELYARAVRDAIDADEDEIMPQVNITKDDDRVVWEGDKVLVTVIHKYPDSYPAGETITLKWGNVWCTSAGEMVEWVKNNDKDVTDWAERLHQLLGTPTCCADPPMWQIPPPKWRRLISRQATMNLTPCSRNGLIPMLPCRILKITRILGRGSAIPTIGRITERNTALANSSFSRVQTRQ